MLLVAALVVGQLATPSLEGPIFQASQVSPGFEFGSLSGSGMGAECACAAVTGSRGEVMTFARVGNATCTKGTSGLRVTGIANGDLVVCAGNQPRAMRDGDGVLGLFQESAARTNSCLRSQEIDNASWTKTGTGVAAPTVTADFAVAPDGTTTAERVQIAACPAAGNESMVSASYSASALAWAHTVYIKGNGGSGSVHLAVYNSSSGLSAAANCAFVATSWSRCELLYAHTAAAAAVYYIGCKNSGTGAANTGAADVLVWGAQVEAGDRATSYIPTAAAGVTRNAESPPSFATSWAAGTSASVSMSIYTAYTPTTGTWFSAPLPSANPDLLGRLNLGTPGCYIRGPGELAAGSWATGANRWRCTTRRFVELNGASNSGAATTLFAGGTSIAFGNSAFAAAVDGIYSRVCFSPTEGGCR